ncbi:3-dehydroquinate synthase II [Amphibacillus marinus]|uniref:3-dehydroquinate synthase II n=1 Tax=Amphibacillus marinus TaxID=872970 RepID=A0A1H8TXL9_9BACI|nr:3-dehydroquinate synthase II [Amphibacillus marinus]SEO18522.1 3-dehydroquinate synthase II [Amphibacillus marinus]SEO95334.1 3-dehydroquinate synthase II [Amphibacillus marinus]
MEKFHQAHVIEITAIGTGTRVCLDFVDQLAPTEGICIGNTGSGYLVALAENRVTDTYPPRPFRVNAGAIHHYVLLEEDKTGYLAELVPGIKIPVWQDGQSRLVPIGRVKQEKRKLLRIVCQVSHSGQQISVTVQEADSVHLLASNGVAKSVLELKVGDTLSCYPDQPGRHLGEKIDEEITEL